MPTSSPARTLVDLAGVVGRGELEKALEIARIRGTISEAALRGAIALAGPSRGAAAMAAALKAEGEPAITRSTAERRVRALVRAAGLPPPLVNAKVAAYEVDLLWPRHRLIAEIDSYGCHSSRAAFERARVKQGRLAAAGFTVLRITWRRLVHEPQGVIGELAAAIALREVG